MAWLTGWSYRKQITVQDDYVDADLTMFPLYVKIVADADMSTALATGFDVRFTLSDGTTTLYYERESWSGGGGSAVTADFWVNVPSISATGGAIIYIYWGKADAADGQDANNTWQSNYIAVYHLNGTYNGTPNEVIDASGAGNHGTAYRFDGNEQVLGIIGSAQQFDGSNDFISMTGISSAASSYTFSMFLKSTDTTGTYELLFDSKVGRFFLYWSQATQKLGYFDGSYHDIGDPPSDGAWHHVAFLLGPTTGTICIDGTQFGSPAAYTPKPLGDTTNIWAHYNGYAALAGSLDEFRISNTNLGASWAKFEYRNITESDNELTWGAIESPTAFPPRLSRQFRLGPKLVRY